MKADPKLINQALKDSNYKFLGWQNGWQGIVTNGRHEYQKEKYPEYRACIDAGHQRDSISHDQRGNENTVSCDICRIYWKYDCSD